MDEKQSATIYAVAKAAGVSVSTASKALNGKGRMTDETRQRVRTMAQDLGFRRTHARPRTFTVGLLTLDGYGRFTPQILAGVEDALAGAECQLMLCDARRDPVRQRHYISTLVERRVDGLIVTGRATDPVPPVAHDLPFPVAYAYTPCSDRDQHCVTVDDEHGGWLAARQLLRQGAERIVYLAGPESVLATRERRAGAERALLEAGLPNSLTVVPGTFSEAFGYAAVTQIMSDSPSPFGLFCASDQIARGAADGLAKLGIRVPDDVPLVGFDNWTLIAEATRPPLTSVDLNLYVQGRRVAQDLLEMVGGSKPEPGTQQLPCSLAVRQSCPAAPGTDPVWHSASPMIPDA